MGRSILVLLPLLASCSVFPLSEADCKPASWRQRGYDHGYGGNPRQDLRLIPECRKLYGVEVAQAEYLEGWKEGHNEWDRLIGSFQHKNR